MTDELWKARFAVKRAVLDVVAQEYHEVDTADKSAHADYLSDMLDEALEEYAEAYLMEQTRKEAEVMKARLEEEMKKPQKIELYDPKTYYMSFNVDAGVPYTDLMNHFFNRRAD